MNHASVSPPVPARAAGQLLAAALALAACGTRAAEIKPPEIAYGQDMCEACGMLIDSPQFAAAAVTSDGQGHKFDDLGEMFAFYQQHPDEQVQAWFVHDYGSGDWTRAEQAFFIKSSDLHTPMGSGMAAFATREAAQAEADQLGAKVMTFDEARASAPGMG